jgi:hypothetical protein
MIAYANADRKLVWKLDVKVSLSRSMGEPPQYQNGFDQSESNGSPPPGTHCPTNAFAIAS